MNVIVKWIQNIKEREIQLKLKGYRDKVELIRKRSLESWDDQQLQAESLRLKKEATKNIFLNANLLFLVRVFEYAASYNFELFAKYPYAGQDYTIL